MKKCKVCKVEKETFEFRQHHNSCISCESSIAKLRNDKNKILKDLLRQDWEKMHKYIIEIYSAYKKKSTTDVICVAKEISRYFEFKKSQAIDIDAKIKAESGVNSNENN